MGLDAVATGGSLNWYAPYTLTADALVYYDITIDGITTGTTPFGAYNEIGIQFGGTGTMIFIVACCLGPLRIHGVLTLPIGTIIQGDYLNLDSITHYLSGVILVFYPGNV